MLDVITTVGVISGSCWTSVILLSNIINYFEKIYIYIKILNIYAIAILVVDRGEENLICVVYM